MKKTEKINIAGIVFHIDEDAYETLKDYLEKIYSRFRNADEGDEIIRDVEGRIAEHFQEATQNKDVVDMADVGQVIGLMGAPEDFTDDTDDTPPPETDTIYRRAYKRLFRDPDNAVLGGVSSGLGAYFNIEPVLIRVLFIVFFFLSYGTALIVYLLLWVIIPKAITTAQKLEMRGESVNISSIERKIKDEFESVQGNINRVQRSQGYNKFVNFLNELGNGMLNFMQGGGKVLVFIFAVLLIIIAFTSLAGIMVALLTAGDIFIPGFLTTVIPELHTMTEMANMFAEFDLLLVGIGLTIGIPLLLLIYFGVKLLFRLPAPSRYVGAGALVLWLLGITFMVISSLDLRAGFRTQEGYVQTEDVAVDTAKTLHLRIDPDQGRYGGWDDWDIEFEHVYLTIPEDADGVYTRPQVDVKQSLSGNVELRLERKARGASRKEARQNAELATYNWNITQDSIINLDAFYIVEPLTKWRVQQLHIVLKIPEGTNLYLDDNLYDYLYDVENKQNMWDGEMIGKTWHMTPTGLSLHKAASPQGKTKEVDGADIDKMKEELESLSFSLN